MKILDLDKVTFATNLNYNTLQDICLKLDKEEKCILFAKKDDGAIELFRLILGLEKNYKGIINYKGCNIKNLNFKDSNIFYIPQTPIFFENKSVEYNLKYFLKLREKDKNKLKQKIVDVLLKYDLSNIKNKKIKVLDVFEKLKLAFARSDLRIIDLVLIEDVLEGLDESLKIKIIELIQKFVTDHNSALFFWVSDENLLKYFDTLTKYKLEYGTLKFML